MCTIEVSQTPIPPHRHHTVLFNTEQVEKLEEVIQKHDEQTPVVADEDGKETAKSPPKVSFASVEIREYARCLGNHPTTYHDGPSLSIDWNYKTKGTIDLDKYEERKERRAEVRRSLLFTAKKQRRFLLHVQDWSDGCQIVPGHIRTKIIRHHTECTEKEIKKNIKQSYKTDRQRQICAEDQDFEFLHIVLESAQRKLIRAKKRMLQRRRSPQKDKEDEKKKKQHTQKRKLYMRKKQISPLIVDDGSNNTSSGS